MIDKQVPDMKTALSGIPDGASVMAAGFGDAGVPNDLIAGMTELGLKHLTMVGNGAVSERIGHGQLIVSGAVDKFISSFPRAPSAKLFDPGTSTADVELEIVPQGTLAERIRAGGSGVPAFFTKTGAGTPLADGKETREIDGETYVLEHAIKADVSLIKAKVADRWGNLIYAKACRNFNPIMAMAGELTIVQVEKVVEPGELDPEQVVTPGIFVDRILVVENPAIIQELEDE
jgi:3-oxoadipate CoA-transferase alpha subunit